MQKEKLLLEILSDDAWRVELCSRSFKHFWLYYFLEHFETQLAEFHKEWLGDIVSWDKIAWMAFRESLKTSIVKAYLVWCTVYKKKRFICWYWHDLTASMSNLFDVISILQTNDKIVNDFWMLFPYSQKSAKKERRSVKEFVTTNFIKFRALSLWHGGRGLQFATIDWVFRPDCVVLDDLDTDDSVRNKNIIDQNYAWLRKQVFWWWSSSMQVIALLNIVWMDWLWVRIMRDYKWQKWWRTRHVPITKNWELTWKQRFVMTNDEAIETWKISLEQKLIDQWREWYSFNYDLVPIVTWSQYFKQDWIKPILPSFTEIRDYPWLRIYRPPRGGLFYGVDTSEWVDWWDFSSIIVRDINGLVYATYRWLIRPESLSGVIGYLVSLWYIWTIGIEKNNTWHATIAEALKNPWSNMLYRERKVNERTEEKKDKFGWRTDWETRPIMLSHYRKMIEWVRWFDGKIIENPKTVEFDDRIIEEIPFFIFDRDNVPRAVSPNKDDMIIADAICHQMMKFPYLTF